MMSAQLKKLETLLLKRSKLLDKLKELDSMERQILEEIEPSGRDVQDVLYEWGLNNGDFLVCSEFEQFIRVNNDSITFVNIKYDNASLEEEVLYFYSPHARLRLSKHQDGQFRITYQYPNVRTKDVTWNSDWSRIFIKRA